MQVSEYKVEETAEKAVARVPVSLSKRLVAEALGTGLLVAAVVGSGIMGERLSGGNAGVALLANSLATGAALLALILALGPISGAHFNPVVTIALAVRRQIAWSQVLPFSLAQLAGGMGGVMLANYMFGVPLLQPSEHVRTGGPQWVSEVLATGGLLGVILGVSASRPRAVAIAVGAYITAAYWFTSSTSFANPVVTIARAWTNTFSGIRPIDVPAFVVAQSAGLALALLLFGWLLPVRREES